MSTPLRENLLPESLRSSTLRTVLREQEAAGETFALEEWGWDCAALIEDETHPAPAFQRLTAERLAWLAEAINSRAEAPVIRCNLGSPDPSVGSHEARALPPRGIVAEAKFVPPALWCRIIQRVKDGVGLFDEAIRAGWDKRSIAFVPGGEPQAPHGWDLDHYALLGPETSGQAWLGLPNLQARARTGANGEPLQICTRALEYEDEPEPADPAAEGGHAAEEEWTMDPEQLKAMFAEFLGSMKAMLAESMPARTPEPTPEERAAAEAAATEATERSAAWTTEVTDRLDRCIVDRRLSVRDRPALVTSISAMGREKGEPEVKAVEARKPAPAVEPLDTSGLSERSRAALTNLRTGVRVEDTDIHRTMSYGEIRTQIGVRPGAELTPEQADQVLAIRRRQTQVSA